MPLDPQPAPHGLLRCSGPALAIFSILRILTSVLASTAIRPPLSYDRPGVLLPPHTTLTGRFADPLHFVPHFVPNDMWAPDGEHIACACPHASSTLLNTSAHMCTASFDYPLHPCLFLRPATDPLPDLTPYVVRVLPLTHQREAVLAISPPRPLSRCSQRPHESPRFLLHRISTDTLGWRRDTRFDDIWAPETFSLVCPCFPYVSRVPFIAD